MLATIVIVTLALAELSVANQLAAVPLRYAI
jgi:hypothetical protein